jgi:hypothetical protein
VDSWGLGRRKKKRKAMVDSWGLGRRKKKRKATVNCDGVAAYYFCIVLN